MCANENVLLRWAAHILMGLLVWGLGVRASYAAPTAYEVMTLLHQQVAVPVEFSTGEVFSYSDGMLHRHYRFTMGRQWDAATRTEIVRLDTERVPGIPEDRMSNALGVRYLLERRGQDVPRQWLYLLSLKTVRSRQSVDLRDYALQSDFRLYDLTALVNLDDYTYDFGVKQGDTLVIEGKPRSALVPYERTTFLVVRHGDSYRLTEAISEIAGHQRHAVWSHYREIAPGQVRPRRIVVSSEEGWTELYIQRWVIPSPASTAPQIFNPEAMALTPLPLTFVDDYR